MGSCVPEGDPSVPPGSLAGMTPPGGGSLLGKGGSASGGSAWEDVLGAGISLATWASPGTTATLASTSAGLWEAACVGGAGGTVLQEGSGPEFTLAGGCQELLNAGAPGPWASVRGGSRVATSPVGPGVPAGLERPTTAGTGTGRSPWAVSTQVTGRGTLAATRGPPTCVRLRGWIGRGVGLGTAGRKGDASGRLCFRDAVGACDCPRPLPGQLTETRLGPRPGAPEAAGAVPSGPVKAGARGRACMVESLLSLAEGPASCQEPEVPGLAAAGVPGPESGTFETVGPRAGRPCGVCGRGGWRITGEETSRWDGSTTGPRAASLARAS